MSVAGRLLQNLLLWRKAFNNDVHCLRALEGENKSQGRAIIEALFIQKKKKKVKNKKEARRKQASLFFIAITNRYIKENMINKSKKPDETYF